MSRLPRLSGMSLAAVGLVTLVSCGGPPPPSTPAGGTSQAVVPAQPSPQLCRLVKPDGGKCVTLQQQPMQPVATATGYATQVSWTLTNECSYPMQVTWGWSEGQTAGQTVLAQGQSTEASCLWNVEGCTGSIDWVYRCSQIQ